MLALALLNSSASASHILFRIYETEAGDRAEKANAWPSPLDLKRSGLLELLIRSRLRMRRLWLHLLDVVSMEMPSRAYGALWAMPLTL